LHSLYNFAADRTVLLGAVVPGTCLPSRFFGNVRTEPLPREGVYRAVAVAPFGPFWGCIKGAVSQRVRDGVRVRCWPEVFASLPEQRRAFLLVNL
jgi:hypothetical protein